MITHGRVQSGNTGDTDMCECVIICPVKMSFAKETNDEWIARRYLTMDEGKEISESTIDNMAA